MNEIITLGAMEVAIIMGLAQLIKGLGIPAKVLPFLNILMGIGGAFLFMDAPVKAVIIAGLVAGLTSSGVFDLGKSFYNKG